MVATRPHRMDFAAVMRVSVRDNYRKFWWFTAGALVIAAILLFSPAQNIPLAIVCLIAASSVPYLRSLNMLRLLKKSPLAYRDHVVEFDKDEMRTFEGDELVSKFKYSDIFKFRLLPEGLQIWISPQIWTFVSRSAFEPADFVEEAHRLMTVASSNMRPN